MKINHIGIVVDDVEKHAKYYQILGFRKVGKKHLDNLQEVEIVFIKNFEDNIMLELISPASSTSPAYNTLTKGGGLNHLCYEVSDINEKIIELRNNGFKLLKKPMPAIAFENKLVAFLYSQKIGLIELLEC